MFVISHKDIYWTISIEKGTSSLIEAYVGPKRALTPIAQETVAMSIKFTPLPGGESNLDCGSGILIKVHIELSSS